MQVGNAMVVAFEYTLKNNEGEVLDASEEGKPLTYLHGCGNIISGLEDQLEELKEGDTFDVKIAPKDGYGEKDPRKFLTLKREQFPKEMTLEPEQNYVMNTPEGPRDIKVLKVEGEEVKVDANHRLAGVELNFVGKIISIREGAPEELEHGHVHGEGGHHH